MDVFSLVSAPVLMLAIFCSKSIRADLTEALTYYETLSIEDLGHQVVKRSLDGNQAEERRLHFISLGREFRLHLRVKKKIADRKLRVVAVDEQNREEEVKADLHNFYEGYVYDEPWTSDANAFFDDDGTLTATIRTKDDLYSIEPTWRHKDEEPRPNSMIIYRRSDLKMDEDLGKSFCGYIKSPASEGIHHHHRNQHHHASDEDHHRSKRQSDSRSSSMKNTCPLYLVADYRFYSLMGHNSRSRTVNYLIGLVDRVDKIFRDTTFGDYTGMGFEVKEIRIHEGYTVPTEKDPVHYNTRQSLDTRDLLEAFSDNKNNDAFCLAHLFTHQKFAGGVLGLAYISSSRRRSVGGVCTAVYYKDDKALYLNTGWSSSLNRYDRRLLTQEADLVTTHEFGHNWGSEHDPDSAECSPSSSDGGKYIMYTYSVSGYEKNNKIFSNCSRRAIGGVLRAKSADCFTEKSKAFCGNFEVEEGEECDAGHRVTDDPCCDVSCHLRPSAVCSDINDVCCEDCQFARPDFICNEAVNGSCLAQANCTGNSSKCPPQMFREDGHSCLNSGECEGGVCKSLCKRHNMESCVCDEPELSCLLCCETSSGNCTQYPGSERPTLADGSPCASGFCKEGVCMEEKRDLVARFWSIIENISPDALVKFMRANIVGTIIVLSLVIWLPASCFISYVDRKRQREKDLRKYGPDSVSAAYDEYDWPKPPVTIKKIEGTKTRQPLRLAIPPPTYRAGREPHQVNVQRQPQFYARHQSWTTNY